MAKTMKQVHQEALEAVSAKIAEVGSGGYSAAELLAAVETLAILDDMLPSSSALEDALKGALEDAGNEGLVILVADEEGNVQILSAESAEHGEPVDDTAATKSELPS